MMEWIYWTISWILLLWHTVWDKLLPGSGRFLATNWDWILAIVFLVITVRVILFPVFVKQIRSQRAMQALQPKMKALQEKHKGDRETLQKELMELYRAEKVNPLMGCLPMFLQIPVFLGLFHVLKRLNPENGGKARYGWTETEFIRASAARLFNAPITAKFSSSASDLAALHANATTVKVVAGFLVIIMMVTTYMTSRQMILKTGWSEDPQQRMIQKLMLYGIPVSLLLSGWAFPIGVIIYWVTTNLFSYGQQYWVLHKYPPPALATGGKLASSSPATASAIAPAARRPAPKDAKGGRSNGAGATAGSGTAVGRAGAAVSGVGRASAAAVRRLGSLGRKPTEAPERADTTNNGGKPATAGRALAPRPGAKPVNRKKGAKRRSG
ncbi:MAG: membrane protein insertase YidC [Micromonosporaceae bacterium]